jgi:hypothetical protein
MTALIARYGHALDIFLNRRLHNLLNRSIVSKMNHFYAGVLENPAHDIYGGVMAVEKRGRCDNPYVVLGFVGLDFRCHFTSGSLTWVGISLLLFSSSTLTI